MINQDEVEKIDTIEVQPNVAITTEEQDKTIINNVEKEKPENEIRFESKKNLNIEELKRKPTFYDAIKSFFLLGILCTIVAIIIPIYSGLWYKTIINDGTTMVIDLKNNEGIFVKENEVEYFSLVAQIPGPSMLKEKLSAIDNIEYKTNILWRRGYVYYSVDVEPFSEKLKKLYDNNDGTVTINYLDAASQLIYSLDLPIREGIKVVNSSDEGVGLSYKGKFQLNPFEFKSIINIELTYSLPKY